MRIIGGYLGGRTYKFSGNPRIKPMSEKMRGAIFSALGDINSLKVLDAYSGSGAISIEALSRGASTATAIEKDKRAASQLLVNAASFKLENLKVINRGVNSWLNDNSQTFDLIIADPPYKEADIKTIEKLARTCADGGTLVLSWPPINELPYELPPLKLVSKKDYGDGSLGFYK